MHTAVQSDGTYKTRTSNPLWAKKIYYWTEKQLIALVSPFMFQCILSSPSDFQRLRNVKEFVSDQLSFYISWKRLLVSCLTLSIICALMVHLTIVGHFEWKTLPLIRFKYDLDKDRDKASKLHLRCLQNMDSRMLILLFWTNFQRELHITNIFGWSTWY